jgi:tRNA(Leu) C34 or U34 (ribose-2'-O)-methylase TrmL
MDRARKYGAGQTPAVVLVNPKYPHNVGAVIRACSCFGAVQVWMTGDRVPTVGYEGYRLPREERMKGYQDVELFNNEYPLDAFPKGSTPIAVEVNDNSENLVDFVHPENGVYVFGPEDGSIPKGIRVCCHRFLYIPSFHCLNLAAAVYVILYDRMAKLDAALRPADKRFISDN